MTIALGADSQTQVRVPQYAHASLPASALAGLLYQQTDGQRGLWADNGTVVYPTSLTFNVMEFGAKFDGATDDTSAINAAISAANAAGGGRVLLPSGKAIVTSVLMLPKVWLQGQGWGATVLQPKAAQNAAIVTNSGQLYQAIISDLTISGLAIANTGANKLGSSCDGILLSNVSGCRIERVRVIMVGGRGIALSATGQGDPTTGPDGTSADGAHGNWIVGNFVERVGSHGVHLASGVTDCCVMENEVGGAGYYVGTHWPADDVYNPSGVATTACGIRDDSGTTQIVSNHVHQSALYNYFENAGGDGDTTIVGNVSEKSGSYGIAIAGANKVVVTGNRVRDTAKRTGTAICVYISTSGACVVSGNVLTGGAWGVYFDATATIQTTNLVVGNNCTGCTSGAVYDGGSAGLGNAGFMNLPVIATKANLVKSANVLASYTQATVTVADTANTTFTVTCTGARKGDPVTVSIEEMGDVGTGNFQISAYVSAANTVRVNVNNQSGAAVNGATWTIQTFVFQQ